MSLKFEYVKNMFTCQIGELRSDMIVNVILHGFPGEKGNRNHDLAMSLYECNGQSSFIVHYEGLGQSLGDFNFYESIFHTIDVINQKLQDKGVSKINIIGHSWGGLVGLFLMHKATFAINKIVLLSPFLSIPKNDELLLLINNLKSELPHVLKKSPGVYKTELDRINANLEELSLSSLKLIDIIFANHDDTVSVDDISSFFQLKNVKFNLVTVDQDHSFLKDRVTAIKIVQSMVCQ